MQSLWYTPNHSGWCHLYQNLDFFDISVVNGFNVPMAFSPTTHECTSTDCTGDLNGLCLKELKVPGGSNNPCTVFKTDEYCCTSRTPESCKPRNYSIIFKGACPGAVSYSYDAKLNTCTCPSGNSYKVVFCPSTSSLNWGIASLYTNKWRNHSSEALWHA